MPGFRELLAETLDAITETDIDGAESLLSTGARVLDVREPDEVASGAIAGSILIPRGLMETSVEAQLPNKDETIIVMCAGGTRSAFAARTLELMGYSSVVSMAGGFNAWKDAGKPWAEPHTLSSEQRIRYQRHLNLPEVGAAGQQTLLAAKVLLLGAGGLGSSAALYLAAAGVGTLGIVDMDTVDASNLQRQIIHNVDRVGQHKVDSAAETIRRLNPDVSVVTHAVRLDESNVLELIDGYDVIIDGADNFEARYVLNDASVDLGIPVVHGSIYRFEGHVSVFDPTRGPTYRDMVPTAPPADQAPSCAEAGVLGVLPGIVGCLQAVETIKLLLGIGEPLIGRLLVFDALDMTFSEYALAAGTDDLASQDNSNAVHKH